MYPILWLYYTTRHHSYFFVFLTKSDNIDWTTIAQRNPGDTVKGIFDITKCPEGIATLAGPVKLELAGVAGYLAHRGILSLRFGKYVVAFALSGNSSSGYKALMAVDTVENLEANGSKFHNGIALGNYTDASADE